MSLDADTGLFKYRVFYRHGATEVRSVPEDLFTAFQASVRKEFPDTVVLRIGGVTILNTYPAGDANLLRRGLPPVAHSEFISINRRIGDRRSVQL